MQVVNDDDHVSGRDTESGISIFQIVLLCDDVKTATLRFGASGLDGLAIPIDRANPQTTLGEPERVSTAPTRHIESSPR
jgi:hypothetical protein